MLPKMLQISKVIFCTIFWLSSCSEALNIESSITKATIFYQKPPLNGISSELSLENVEKLQTKKNIKVIIHGFLGSHTHSSIKPLVNAFMAKGTDNIFVADWKDAAGLDYHSSRKAVGRVAVYFAKLLQDFFNLQEIDVNDVHLIGHSLGAHIAGGIGQFFNGTLSRVTGLDPALPLFTPHADDALQATAAQFVDVIHTDFPIFGDLTPRGTADFYPNFGHAPQRGCDDVDLIAASRILFEAYSCSHNRAVLFYAESVGLPKNFPAIPCSLNGIKHRNVKICYEKLEDLNLNRTVVANAIATMDDNSSVVYYMGENVERSATGIFYLQTNSLPPYGMGAYTRF